MEWGNEKNASEMVANSDEQNLRIKPLLFTFEIFAKIFKGKSLHTLIQQFAETVHL